MGTLKDLGIDVGVNLDFVKIQNVKVPISFTMATMEFIADVYGEDYTVFERDLNNMLMTENGEQRKTLMPSRGNIKIMRALTYSMIRSGGTQTTPEELERVVPFSQVPELFNTCMSVFISQNFQEEDLKKSQKPQDFQNRKKKKGKRNKKKK